MAAAGSELNLQVLDFPALHVRDGVLSGRIEVQSADLHVASSSGATDYRIQGPIPETLHFTTQQSAQNLAQLLLEHVAPWQIDNLLVGELRFVREVKSAQGPVAGAEPWASTLLSGKIRLLETKTEIKLHADDWLKLGRVQGHRLVIEFLEKPSRFKLQFQGTVTKVETGPTGFVRNRAPTWLECLYHQQQLALFWTAAAFLWGMFWSARKLL